MSEAVTAYHKVTASKEFLEIERLLLKASHDEAQALKDREVKVEKRLNKKWQAALSKKEAQHAAELAEKEALIAELKKQLRLSKQPE